MAGTRGGGGDVFVVALDPWPRDTAPVRAVPAGWSVYYRIVRRVPRGRVTTYGAVAALAGKPRAARQVGFAMAALRGAKHDVPWQRVLGARTKAYGAISILDPMGAAVQRAKLAEEGIAFDDRGRVALARYGWPRPRAGQPSRRRPAPRGRPARQR